MQKNSVWGAIAVLAFILATAGVLSCSKPQAQAESGPADIVMTSCTACHPASNICSALGKKSRDEWSATVSRMVEKGASVEKQRIPAVVEYLASLKPGASPVCK
jgi:cytochrome c5